MFCALGWAIGPAGAAELPPPVARAVASSGLPAKSFGLYAQEVGGDREVFALNEDAPYTMASTTKIVTSLMALDLLGPNFRWNTSAFLRGSLQDGRLTGNLLIVGGGDAQLSSADLRAWFQRMRDQGLREIDGDIVVDRNAFQFGLADHEGTPMRTVSERRHVLPDAMAIDEGVVTLVVGASRAGRPPITLTPTLADVRIDNRVSPGPTCDVEPRWQAEPNDPTRATIVVQGTWTPTCVTQAIPFVPPPSAGIAARVVPSLWASVGGVLRGRVVSAPMVPGVSPIPKGADGEPLRPWSLHSSKPLPELVRDINKVSDNLGARNLLLSLSPGFPDRPATLAGAQKILGMWLREKGMDEYDVWLETGSGLSHRERAKPRALVQLLREAWKAQQAQGFFESLPVAGVDGTLRNRLQGGKAMGQAHLKTGTLNDTRALAGYVQGASGKMYAVALIVNDAAPARGQPALDAMVEWLARNG